MLLAIDIGNTSITLGVFQGSGLHATFSMPTNTETEAAVYRDEITALMKTAGITIPLEGTIVSSVVPQVTETVRNAVRAMGTKEPLCVSSSLETGLGFDVDNPEGIGSDRIANVVAAHEFLGSPCLVADFGTATTISACNKRNFVGGAILPGISLMARTLHMGTSRLPYIDFSGGSLSGESQPHAMGKNTTECIISGIIYGTAGAVERVIREMEAAEDCTFGIVITGGHHQLIAPHLTRAVHQDPHLTIKGLRLLFERNN